MSSGRTEAAQDDTHIQIWFCDGVTTTCPDTQASYSRGNSLLTHCWSSVLRFCWPPGCIAWGANWTHKKSTAILVDVLC